MSPSEKDVWRMSIALAASERASCLRASVGTVLFDSKDRIIGIGVNGPPVGEPNCDAFCLGTKSFEKCACRAIHSEQNALIQCTNIANIDTIACTLLPCEECSKLIANTSAKTLLYINFAPQGYGKSFEILKNLDVKKVNLGKKHKYYILWQNIKQRCYNPKTPKFKYYGGRGIKMHAPWLCNSLDFIIYILTELGPCPKNCSLERINNNGNYEPGNLKWANQSEQVLNTKDRQSTSNTGIKYVNYIARLRILKTVSALLRQLKR